MKIVTILILLLLQYTQQTDFINCQVAHLSQRICLLCNPNFELDQGKCERCKPSFTLINDKCLSNVLPIASFKELKPIAPAPEWPAQESTKTSTDNIKISANSYDKTKVLPSQSWEENPQLLSLLKSPGFQSYIASLIQQYTTLKTTTAKIHSRENPCLSYLNGGKDICTQCAPEYHIVNGLCFFTIVTPTSSDSDSQPKKQNTAATTSSSSSPSIFTSSQTFLPFYLNTAPINFIVGQSNTDSSQINDNVSQISSTSTQASSDPNCKIPGNQSCSECYSFFYYNQTLDRCFATNPLCKTVTADNLCITCYEGYSPLQGNCILDIILQVINNSNAANRYQIQPPVQANSTISPISLPQPSNTTNTQLPTSGSISLTPSPSSDPYCLDSAQSGCIGCSWRYYLKQGLCNLVDNQCSKWTTDGICLECYVGYIAVNGSCQFLSEIPPQDKPNSVQCPFRTVEINKFCVHVSDDCATWSVIDATCTSCYQGYEVVNGICQRSAP